ncbi:hypothetical protein O3Q51_14120 [Cryomorphaceae bacterium 1068]|nr:hypothetical protein [Cryomorphaceae bacterium 1068]
MKRAEIILTSLVVIAMTMNYLKLPFNGVLSVLSITGLAVYYYPFFPLMVTGNSLKTLFSGTKSKSVLFMAFVTGIGLSTLLVGLLFKIQLWPMGDTLLTVGLFSTVVLMAVNAFRFKKTAEDLFKGLLIRCAVAFFVGALAYLISNDALLEHHFGDNPEYMEAYKEWTENPDDAEAIERLQREQMKLQEVERKSAN